MLGPRIETPGNQVAVRFHRWHPSYSGTSCCR